MKRIEPRQRHGARSLSKGCEGSRQTLHVGIKGSRVESECGGEELGYCRSLEF
jgi:hypothetical protein